MTKVRQKSCFAAFPFPLRYPKNFNIDILVTTYYFIEKKVFDPMFEVL